MRGARFLLLVLMLASLGATYTPPLPKDSAIFKGAEPVRERDPARAVLFQGRGIKLVEKGNCEPAIQQFRRNSST